MSFFIFFVDGVHEWAFYPSPTRPTSPSSIAKGEGEMARKGFSSTKAKQTIQALSSPFLPRRAVNTECWPSRGFWSSPSPTPNQKHVVEPQSNTDPLQDLSGYKRCRLTLLLAGAKRLSLWLGGFRNPVVSPKLSYLATSDERLYIDRDKISNFYKVIFRSG